MFLGPADEADWYLRVGWDSARHWFSSQHTVCELFADICGCNESLTLVDGEFVEVPESLKEFEFERSRLGTVVDEEGGVLSALAHVDSAKV